MADQAKELKLLGNVENRIVFAATDAALQAILKTYLSPMLLKLNSPNEEVRKKVIAICQHVNTRIKSASIQLPVAALLTQFKDGGSSLLLRNFDLMYIQRGIEGMAPEELQVLLPNFTHSIASLPPAHQKTLFHILLRAINRLPTLPLRGTPEAEAFQNALDLANHRPDSTFLADKFANLLLLAVNVFLPVASGAEPRPNPLTCPGLTPDEFDFLTGGKRETFPTSEISGLKVKVLRYLQVAGFSDEELYIPYLVAAGSDTGSQILDIGEDGIKKININLDQTKLKLTSEEKDGSDSSNVVGINLIGRLYRMYFGSREEQLPAVKPAMQTRVLSIFTKSLLAINPDIVDSSLVRQVVEDGLLVTAPEHNLKFRTAVFGYIVHITRLGSDELLHQVAPGVVESIRLWIVSEGWPRNNTSQTNNTAMSLRGRAYITMGLLARRQPNLILENSLQLLRFLFASIRGETKELRVSVEESISSTLPCLPFLTSPQRDELREMLLESVVEDHDMTGWSSYLKVANRGLGFGDHGRIWICLLASGSAVSSTDGRRDVVEEGKKGLHPYWYRVLNPQSPIKTGVYNKEKTESDADRMDVDETSSTIAPYDFYAFPEFEPLIEYLTSGDNKIPGIFLHSHFSHGKSISPLIRNVPKAIFSQMMVFLKSVMFMNAVKDTPVGDIDSENMDLDKTKAASNEVVVDEDWDIKTANALATSKIIRSQYRNYLSGSVSSASTFINLLLAGILYQPEPIQSCGDVLTELIPLLPKALAQDLVVSAKASDWQGLKSVVWSAKRTTRELGGYVLGVLAAEDARKGGDVSGLVTRFHTKIAEWDGNWGLDELSKVHGSLITLPILLGHLSISTPSMTTVPLTATVLSEDLQKIVGIYTHILLESRDTMLVEASILGLTQLAQYIIIKPESIAEKQSAIFAKLKTLGESGNEKAVLALGALSLIYPVKHTEPTEVEGTDTAVEEDAVIKIKKILLLIYNSKMPELSFATGEALSVMAAGWDADVLGRKMDVDQGSVLSGGIDHRGNGRLLTSLVDEVLDLRIKGGSATARKAACVWLLSLLQFCGGLKEVKARFEDIHTAFRLYLSDRDDFVQETASRGLTLVYEFGDKDMKDDLVRSLIASFTGNAKSLAGQVQADTQLFEPGTLPTGDGSVSTYKDIMSLAAEVGDPGLVYKFMSLASHSAMWTSRAAFGRFGLGNIMSNSEDLLAANPKLYAKLFRYRFDPNPNVQKSMNDIWSALVKDSAGTIDLYFDSIMTDLLKSIVDKEWRTREASCAAIGDLVQGKPIDKYEKYLQQIWTLSFKVLDDIKTSVREAAVKLCRVLTASLIRNVSVESGSSDKDADIVLKNVIPFLMGPSGLEAGAEEVQKFALLTLIKLIKKGGKSLRPYIPELVEHLLTLLSSLEPQAMNYLHLNAAKYNLTEDKIDAARLSSVRQSPMMDAIERSIDIADEATMDKLVPRIISSMKKAVGMPSKVGCSKLIVTLVVRHNFLFKQYANDVLKAVRGVLLDINETVSASYATAAGYLSRLANDKAILELLASCKDLYFLHEDERARVLSGTTIHAISKYASDKFNGLASEILPFVFIAKHDIDKTAATEFEKAWTENTGGSGAVKLYLPEILQLASQNLTSHRWSVKQTSALSISEACKSIGSDLSIQQADLLWPALVKSVSGKSWVGKEVVLEGFVELAVNAPASFLSEDDHQEEITKIILREANRNNPEYRAHAIGCLAKYANSAPQLDLSDDIFSIVEKALEDEDEDDATADKMDVDKDHKFSGKSWRNITLRQAVVALSAGSESVKPLRRYLDFLDKYYPHFDNEAKLSATSGLEKAIGHIEAKASVSDAVEWNVLLVRLWERLHELGSDNSLEAVRTKAAVVTAKLGDFLTQGKGNELVATRTKMLEDLLGMLKRERSPVVLKSLNHAYKTLESSSSR